MKPAWLLGALALGTAAILRRHRLEAPLRIGAALGVAAMAVYGTGVVQMPDVAGILEDVGSTLGPWTYLLVGVMSFLEAGLGVGMVVPGETTVVIGGMVAGQGEIDIVVLIALAWTTAFLGDLTGYMLGRKLGRPFLERHGPRFGVGPERVALVDDFYDRHGGKTVLIGRFVGFMRSLSPFLAGSSKMALRRFLPYDILGAGLQSAALCIVGYLFWRSIDRVLDLVQRGALAFGVAVAAIVAAVLAYRWLRVAENRAAAIGWLEARRGHAAARWALAAIERARWPARFLVGRVTPGNYGLELTTLLALASVGGYVFLGYLLSLEAGELTPGDRRGNDWAGTLQAGPLDQLAALLHLLGSFPVTAAAVAFAGAALIARRHLLEGLALWWGLGLTALALLIVKGAVWSPDAAGWPQGEALRPRPAPGAEPSPSYPSAVAAYSVAWIAIALALRHSVERLSRVAALLVVAILLSCGAALSVVYRGDDWFSDAAGGLGLGVLTFCAAGTCALALDWLKRFASAPRARRRG